MIHPCLIRGKKKRGMVAQVHWPLEEGEDLDAYMLRMVPTRITHFSAAIKACQQLVKHVYAKGEDAATRYMLPRCRYMLPRCRLDVTCCLDVA